MEKQYLIIHNYLQKCMDNLVKISIPTLDKYEYISTCNEIRLFVREIDNLSQNQFILKDTSEAATFFHDDLWNHLFFSDLLRLFTEVNFRKTFFKYLPSKNNKLESKLKILSFSFIKINIKNFLKIILKFSFSKKKLVYFLNPEISLIKSTPFLIPFDIIKDFLVSKDKQIFGYFFFH